MKRSVFAVLVVFASIISCNTSNNSHKLLRTDNLPLQEYTIDITRDTTLLTKNGALLKIPKGSLVTDKGSSVTLEIKEAYSLQQMIEAGLTTQSNGEPLSSGGMIYINAAAGQNVTITQSIKVAVPSGSLSKGMQLFNGEKDENGNVNWKEPTALPENKQLNSIELGQTLFQSKCASCHAIGKDMTGPDLAHYLKRFTSEEQSWRKYHYHYLDRDTGGDVCDLYSYNLKKMFGSIGTVFPNLSNGDLDNIYRYIENESDKNNLPFPSHAYLNDCIDSCRVYWENVLSLREKKEDIISKKDKLVKDNGSLVEEKKEPAPPTISNDPIGPPAPVDYEEKVSPQNYEAEYYQFTIESFGWYNIDILLKGINGVEESELFVRITGQYREKIKVYLIIPSVKVYVEGGPAERDKEEFAFYLKNGKIMLPQNVKAYIMAVTETEESIAFALKEFNTTLKQQFDISLSPSTKEAFSAAINGISMDKLTIKVADAKNANEIKKTNTDIKNIDQQLKNAEYLKPKNCDCDCGSPTTFPFKVAIENNEADTLMDSNK